jgi:hypothetical protein
VLGGKELERLNAQKQALVAESDLNRLVLQAELHNLHMAANQLKEAVGRPGRLAPLLLVLGPLAGFLLRRKPERSSSWLTRAMALAKWIGPLYGVWRGFAAGRRKAGTEGPQI